MSALRVLRRYILIKSAEGRANEVRGYVADEIVRFSKAFHVEPETLMSALDSVPDDEALACKLLETIFKAESILRKQRKEERARAAQVAASAHARAARWQGERAILDMGALLAHTLTRRNDLLVFICEGAFSVGVFMAPLLDLAKIARVQADLTGWVDRHGLHLRWASGGLNLRSQEDEDAERIVLVLPPMSNVIAA